VLSQEATKQKERKVDMGNQQTSNPPFLPIKRLTPEELKERKAKDCVLNATINTDQDTNAKNCS
jgi:hypothetical protein